MAADTSPERTVLRTRPARVLLLGGTTEGFELAAGLSARPGLTVISSLAGRVSNPRLPAGRVRTGGFGGVAGLEAYLRDEAIDVVVDATHPYAAKISGNAELACRSAALPLIAMERPPWEMRADDRWRPVPDMQAAASAADRPGNRVLLSIGRQELGPFCGCDMAWFLVRAIDAPSTGLPPHAELMLRRGPFDLADELQVIREHRINLIVSKNSGGAATYAKIEAARELGVPVVMVARPSKHSVPTVSRISDVLQKLAGMFQ